MTLTTHSIIAAAVTKPLMRMNPIFAFIIAVASHYLSDAIPHWDYTVGSIENLEDKEKRRFGHDRHAIRKDMMHFALDGFLGAAVVLAAVRPATLQQWMWAWAAIIGGCLPDFLQGLYALTKPPLLRLHQRLHDFFHTSIRLGPYPLVGIPLQVIIAVIALSILI